MRGQAEVDAQRQRMNEDAYFLTIKTMVVKGDNPDMVRASQRFERMN